MLLSVSGLHAHYGKSHVLHGVSFDIAAPAIVSLLGRNGSGRSTALKAMMGLVPPSAGSVRLDGTEIAGLRPYRIARLGLGYVPEEREIFPNLSVAENLEMGVQPAAAGRPRWRVEDMYGYFPRLLERRDTKAGHLSGGEKQMLTICRSLLGNPRVLLIDEPTEGLAPKIVEQMAETLKALKAEGLTLILSEQNLHFARLVADRTTIIEKGSIRFSGTMAELMADEDSRQAYLSV
jgi:branched-chain amino acid transport system ATP-binding protein